MSDDEVFTLIACLFLAVWGCKQWVGGLLVFEPPSRRGVTQVLGWLLLPPLAGAAMLFVLLRWSSSDVRNSGIYIMFYLLMWIAWTGLWNQIMPFFGISCRDDAFERNNSAAELAIGGGLLGVTFIFAGSNIGEGPGWWVVVFCATLATASLLLLWMVGNQMTRVAEDITVDRDISAGWRTAGFFIGAGLILGRAVAGDWHSADATVVDFLQKGAPVLIVWATEVAMDQIMGPTPKRPAPDKFLCGFLPFLILVGAGVGDVFLQGPW